MREICTSGLKRGAEFTLRPYSTGSLSPFLVSFRHWGGFKATCLCGEKSAWDLATDHFEVDGQLLLQICRNEFRDTLERSLGTRKQERRGAAAPRLLQSGYRANEAYRQPQPQPQ